MIRIGNILINPDDVSSIHQDIKLPPDDRQRGFHIIQIIYKNGVVKNFNSREIGMSYPQFIEEFMNETKKAEDRKLLKVMAAVNKNG